MSNDSDVILFIEDDSFDLDPADETGPTLDLGEEIPDPIYVGPVPEPSPDPDLEAAATEFDLSLAGEILNTTTATAVFDAADLAPVLATAEIDLSLVGGLKSATAAVAFSDLGQSDLSEELLIDVPAPIYVGPVPEPDPVGDEVDLIATEAPLDLASLSATLKAATVGLSSAVPATPFSTEASVDLSATVLLIDSTTGTVADAGTETADASALADVTGELVAVTASADEFSFVMADGADHAADESAALTTADAGSLQAVIGDQATAVFDPEADALLAALEALQQANEMSQVILDLLT